MCMYKAALIICVELLTIGVGYYFAYLSKKENSKHLKIGSYILIIGGIILALSTTAMTVKHMVRHCHKCHHGLKGGPEGFRQGPGPGGPEGMEREEGEGRED